MRRIAAVHNIEPIYDENSEILILGSFPSVKSREERFFYAHPQNRFWRVLADVFGGETPAGIEQKKALLIENRVALWDVAKSCEIAGSADSALVCRQPNDIGKILSCCPIRRVILNGGKAYSLYQKYFSDVGVECRAAPSTSPANAACRLEELIARWRPLLTE